MIRALLFILLFSPSLFAQGTPLEANPVECETLRNYVQEVMVKLIKGSNLQKQSQNLYFDFQCYNHHRSPQGATYIDNTIILNHGYFGSLKTEDALAAVIAHELVHFLRGHEKITNPRANQQQGSMFDRPQMPMHLANLIKQHEDQADKESISILAKAGYSYLGAIEVLDTIEQAHLFPSGNHSTLSQRKETVNEQAKTLNLKPKKTKLFPENIRETVESYYLNDNAVPYDPKSRRIKVL